MRSVSMVYTVDLKRLLDLWRLREDGQWRTVQAGDLEPKPGDKVISDPWRLASYRAPNMVITVGGQEVTVNEPQWPGSGYDVKLRLHRTERPAIPSEEEMLDVIRQGDDRRNNVLALGVDGHFHLFDRHERRGPFDIVSDPTIAVRMETFVAGNGYIGRKSVQKNREWWHKNYLDYLACWTTHLLTGEVNIYDDLGADQGEEEIMRELHEAMAQWA